jgi:hypothetical protein
LATKPQGIVAASADAEEGGAKDEVRSLPAASPAARAGTGAGEAKASASMLCKKTRQFSPAQEAPREVATAYIIGHFFKLRKLKLQVFFLA